MSDEITRPELSLVLPLKNELSGLQVIVQDIRSFFGRLGSRVEIVFVIDSPTNPSEMETKSSLSTEQIQFQWIVNERPLGRARSALLGLRKAKGEIIVLGSADFSVPLGDLLRIYMELVQNQEDLVVIGARNFPGAPMQSKKSFSHSRNSVQLWIDELKRQKFSTLKISDPLSPVVGMRAQTRDKIPLTGKSRWFYNPEIAQMARSLGARISEVPVNYNDQELLKGNLFQRLKRYWIMLTD